MLSFLGYFITLVPDIGKVFFDDIDKEVSFFGCFCDKGLDGVRGCSHKALSLNYADILMICKVFCNKFSFF